MKKILLLSLLLFHSLFLFADIRLPAIIGSHMVLQQKSDIKIWGWCEPGEIIKLKANWDTAVYTTTGSSFAKWSISLKTPEAGGSYEISITGYNNIVLEDVMIGEVWVCSGQSNMEMNVNGGLPYQQDAENATNTKIRFFHIPRTTARYPQEDVKAGWVVCNPKDMKRFSAVGYFFGKKLQEELNLPIGLINTSWGGTPAESWTPEELILNDTSLKKAVARLIPSPGWPVVPAVTYNAMIYPIIQYAIAGAIWYQGEANVENASTYQSLLTTMISAWRRSWQKDFPFYFVQIAPYSGYGDNSSSAFLREAQTKTLSLPGTGMVVISDLVPDIEDIHPKMKKEVGLRLANYALAENYGRKDMAHKSPLYKNMKIEKDKIRVFFEGADKGLMSKDKSLTEFFIAGEDKNFVPANAKIEGNTIVVWNKNIKKPVAVRFGFRNASIPNLYSKEDLPVNLFRTDDWPVHISVARGK